MNTIGVTNPYSPFAFRQENFAGRDEIIKHLVARITPGTDENIAARHVLLLGNGGSGKTWIIKKFLSIMEEGEFQTIYLDAGNYIEDIEGFISDYFDQLNYISHKNIIGEEFKKSISIQIPLGVGISLNKLFNRELPESIYKKINLMFDSTIEFLTKKKKKSIICIDQYGKLTEMSGGYHVVRLFSFLMKECALKNLNNLLIVFAFRPEREGVLKFPFGKDIFNEEIVTRFPIVSFSRSEAVEAISKPATNYLIQYSVDTINYLLDSLGIYNPFDLQLACKLLFDYLLAKNKMLPRRIDIPDKKIKNIIEEGLKAIFNFYTEEQKSVLRVVAQSHPVPSKFDNIFKRINSQTTVGRTSIQTSIQELLDDQTRPLKHTNRGYIISHDLFADYILIHECGGSEKEVSVLEGILEYTSRLYEISGFVIDENLLNRMWVHKSKINFPDNSFKILAISIFKLEDKKQEIHFQWFRTYKERFIDALIELVPSAEGKTIPSLIKAMGTIGDKSFTKELLVYLNHSNKKIKKEAANALGEIQDEFTVQYLSIHLFDADTKVAEACAKALGKIGVEKSLIPLRDSLTNNNELFLRSATKAIAQIGGDEAFKILRNALRRKDQVLRSMTIRSLPFLRHEGTVKLLSGQLRSKKSRFRVEAIKALGRMKEQNNISLVNNYVLDNSLVVALSAVELLAKNFTVDTCSTMLKALASKFAIIRNYSFNQLTSNISLIDVSRIKIYEKDPKELKISKARLLSKLPSEETLAKISRLRKDSNEEVRANFYRILSSFSKELVKKELMFGIKDPSFLVVKTALYAAIEMGLETILIEANEALPNKNRTISWYLSNFFDGFDNKTVDPYLESLINLNEHSKKTIKEKSRILNATFNHASIAPYNKGLHSALNNKKDEEIQKTAILLIGEMGTIAKQEYEQFIQNLHLFIEHRSVAIRIATVQALGCLNYNFGQFNNELIKIIQNDSDNMVRYFAIKSIDMYNKRFDPRPLYPFLNNQSWLIRSETLFKIAEDIKPDNYKKLVKILENRKSNETNFTLYDIDRIYTQIFNNGLFYFGPFDIRYDRGSLEYGECQRILGRLLYTLTKRKTSNDKTNG